MTGPDAEAGGPRRGESQDWTPEVEEIRGTVRELVFPYAEYGGATVTALARLDGHPVGVLATDPYRGTAMSVEGARAITSLVDLRETFHLPVVSLTDQGGMTVGRVAEERGTIRHGGWARPSGDWGSRPPGARGLPRPA